MIVRLTLVAACLFVPFTSPGAQGNELPSIPPIARRLPPPGIEIPAADAQQLLGAVGQLEAQIEGARSGIVAAKLEKYLPDVEIFPKAVRWTVELGEFYDLKELAIADELLAEGRSRIEALAVGRHPWTEQRGAVIRGFRSEIDGSVQPVGLVVPEELDLQSKFPIYIWLHGRGDKTTDLQFIQQRRTRTGEFVMQDGIVVHPYGRHCNAFKFAGESDVWESLASISWFRPDWNRVVLCGFSMGGAGAWHLGAHYADRLTALSPGAGFAETARYQNLTPDRFPPWYEQRLWQLYDVPPVVRNLFNIPVVAYSGELDKQIQAARVMEEAYRGEGRTLPHLIGPGMGHKYHPDTLRKLMQRMSAEAAKPVERPRGGISLQTPTLRYHRKYGVMALELEQHWRDARIDLAWKESPGLESYLKVPEGSLFRRFVPAEMIGSITTRNVAALGLKIDPPGGLGNFTVDGQPIQIDVRTSSKMNEPDVVLVRRDGQWQRAERYPVDDSLRKWPQLQGPIDDAFYEPFLVAVPSGASRHPAVERWVRFELAHFQDRWRRLFRGEVRLKRDVDVTDEDMQRFHVIAWGDADSNQLIRRALGKLPLTWDAQQVALAGKTLSAASHVPVMIYPNPLQNSGRSFFGRKYLVLNSGPTFREGHDSSNSLQTPKLPDWALIDLQELPSAQAPGRIAAAGFFDERWQPRSEEHP